MSPMQLAYIEHFLAMKTPTYTEAARRAGYKDPRRKGSRLMADPRIKAEIKRRRDEMLKDLRADQYTVVKSAVDCVKFDPTALFNEEGTAKLPHEWPEEAKSAVNSIKIEFYEHPDGTPVLVDGKPIPRRVQYTATDRSRANEVLAKLTGALVEKHEVDHLGVIYLPPQKPEGAPFDDFDTD